MKTFDLLTCHFFSHLNFQVFLLLLPHQHKVVVLQIKVQTFNKPLGCMKKERGGVCVLSSKIRWPSGWSTVTAKVWNQCRQCVVKLLDDFSISKKSSRSLLFLSGVFVFVCCFMFPLIYRCHLVEVKCNKF